MGSFRASAAILAAHSGVPPEAVLDVARDGVASRWVVEDAFVDVQDLAWGKGPPRVTIRFVVPTGNDSEEDAAAWRAAKELASAVGTVADWADLRVFRRTKGRWVQLER